MIPIIVPTVANDVQWDADTDEIIFECEYRIEVAITSFGHPAQIYGDPSVCYPAEDPEWHIEAIYRTHSGKRVSDKDPDYDAILAFCEAYVEGEIEDLLFRAGEDHR